MNTELLNLETELESIEHNIFIDTLIKIDDSLKANSLSDYIPLYLSGYSDSDECKLLELRDNKTYLLSLMNYIYGEASLDEIERINREFGNRNGLLKHIMMAINNPDISEFLRLLTILSHISTNS